MRIKTSLRSRKRYTKRNIQLKEDVKFQPNDNIEYRIERPTWLGDGLDEAKLREGRTDLVSIRSDSLKVGFCRFSTRYLILRNIDFLYKVNVFKGLL